MGLLEAWQFNAQRNLSNSFFIIISDINFKLSIQVVGLYLLFVHSFYFLSSLGTPTVAAKIGCKYKLMLSFVFIHETKIFKILRWGKRYQVK
jgi:hypothetical protein